MKQDDALIVNNVGIDTHQEPVAYMREDCHVCRAEGFDASSRVLVISGENRLIATLNVVDKKLFPQNHVGLSRIALERLKVQSGAKVFIGHAPVVVWQQGAGFYIISSGFYLINIRRFCLLAIRPAEHVVQKCWMA